MKKIFHLEGISNASLKKSRDIIDEIFKNPQNDGLSSIFSNRIDELIIQIVREKFRDNVKLQNNIALLATGSYGRGHLNPKSDIDLIILAKNKCNKNLIKIAEEVLYILWDRGFDANCTIKNEKNCISIINKKIEEKSILLDLRFIYGNKDLFLMVRNNIFKIFQNNIEQFVEEEIEEQKRRWKRFGDSTYILEPNIKMVKGGIRDLNAIWWLGRIKYNISSYRDLLTSGEITKEEWRTLVTAFRFYDRVRNFIHLISNRKDERLTYELQEEISLKLNYRDTIASLRVENFMRDYFRNATAISYLAIVLLERTSGKFKKLQKIADIGEFENVGGYLRVKDVRVKDDNLFIKEPSKIFEFFHTCQYYSLLLHPETKKIIVANLQLIDENFIKDRKNAITFQKILASKKNVFKIINLMHELGLIGRYIPEFGRIIAKYQYDKYHVYTVDVHSINTLKEIETFRTEKKNKLYHVVAKKIEDYFILNLAALLHDIGKIHKAKHQEKGGEMVPQIAKRLYLDPAQELLLKFLIGNHTYMYHIATRRDIYSDDSIEEFVAKIQSIKMLDMLYLLTVADIKTVGSDVWSEWKEKLIDGLYKRSHEKLCGFDLDGVSHKRKISNFIKKIEKVTEEDKNGEKKYSFLHSLPIQYFSDLLFSIKNRDKLPLEIFNEHFNLTERLVSSDYAVSFTVDRELSNVVVVTQDQHRLFAKIAGAFTFNNINIVSASIYTRDNQEVLDIFTVNTPVTNPEERLTKFKNDLGLVLKDEIDLAEGINKKKHGSILNKYQKSGIRNEVVIDNKLSKEFTVVDIFTQDRIGLLYDLTSLLATFNIDIFIAKISTAKDRVSDTFYVKKSGVKITNKDEINKLNKTLYKFLV